MTKRRGMLAVLAGLVIAGLSAAFVLALQPAGGGDSSVLWEVPPGTTGTLWVSHGWTLFWEVYGTSVQAEPLGGGAQVILDTSFFNGRMGVPRAAAVTPNGFVVSGLRLEDQGRKRFGALLFFDRRGRLVRERLLQVAMIRDLDALPDGRLVGWWEGLDRAPDGGYRGISACSIFGSDLMPEKDLVPRRPLPEGNSLSGYDGQLLVHAGEKHIHVLDPFSGELRRYTLDGTSLERIALPQLAEKRAVRGWAPAGDAVWLLAAGGKTDGARLLKVVWSDGSVSTDRERAGVARLYPGPSGPLVLGPGNTLRPLETGVAGD